MPLLLTLVRFRREDLMEFEGWMFSNYDWTYLIVFIIVAWCTKVRTTADAHINDLVVIVRVRWDKSLLYRIGMRYRRWFVIYSLHLVGHLTIPEWLGWLSWEVTRDGIAWPITAKLCVWVLWRSRNGTSLTGCRTQKVWHLFHKTTFSFLWRSIRVGLGR